MGMSGRPPSRPVRYRSPGTRPFSRRLEGPRSRSERSYPCRESSNSSVVYPVAWSFYRLLVFPTQYSCLICHLLFSSFNHTDSCQIPIVTLRKGVTFVRNKRAVQICYGSRTKWQYNVAHNWIKACNPLSIRVHLCTCTTHTTEQSSSGVLECLAFKKVKKMSLVWLHNEESSNATEFLQ